MAKKPKMDDLQLNMTPMIDVVFQLIIFFVVTLTIEQEYNKEIKLEKAPDGKAITGKEQQSVMVIEVDRRGNISMHGIRIPSRAMLGDMIKRRFAKAGEFPVMIRGDRKTSHKDIRAVMDLCTAAGLWRINFAAIKEEREI
jgi:biopolymer transport protein ExbD